MSDIEAEWERCAPWLQEALDRDPSYSLEDVRALVMNGSNHILLWPGERSAVVTELVVSPRRRDLHVWLAGGDLAEIQAGLPSIEAFARELCCSRVTLFGRAGWGRALPGFVPQFMAFAKVI